jgi:hypothetical protein
LRYALRWRVIEFTTVATAPPGYTQIGTAGRNDGKPVPVVGASTARRSNSGFVAGSMRRVDGTRSDESPVVADDACRTSLLHPHARRAFEAEVACGRAMRS